MSNRRQAEILKRLRGTGYVEVMDLANLLDVSAATIRRDLSQLEAGGHLLRTHGGAVLPDPLSTSFEPTYAAKKELLVAAKKRIGQAAASLVTEGDTIILDAGSTTFQVGWELRRLRQLTVVSNDVQIIMSLGNRSNLTVIDTGGQIRPHVYTLLGSQTERFLSQLHVNWTFLGADGVDVESGVTNVNIEEVPVKQAMIKAGAQVVLVADHTKFGKSLFAQVCDLSAIQFIITNEAPHPVFIEASDHLGIQLMVVSDEDRQSS